MSREYTPMVTTSGPGSDGATLRFVRNDAMTLGEPHPADPSRSRSADDRRHDEEADREHRLTMGNAVGGERVDAHGTRDQRDEREDAEQRLAILQQRGLTGVEIRLDGANRRDRGRGIDLGNLRSDGVGERARIALAYER